jgi:hypothetical protein
MDRAQGCTRVKSQSLTFSWLALGANFSQFAKLRSDAYRVFANDERQRNGENWPRPSGFHPSTQRSHAGDPGLRRKSPHTLLSSSTARFSLATPTARKLITGSRNR